MEKVMSYLRKYFVTAMGAMAQGLFATLLIGTIIKSVGQYTGLDFLIQISSFASGATGMAIGVAIAISLKADMPSMCEDLPSYKTAEAFFIMR